MNVRLDDRDRLSQGIPPLWASAWGEDEFGAFACFEVKGVEQRMRWIEPGTFTMGSPEREKGRWDDEGPQHEVTLREGFWLADTPCTQELWVAVMGENPSQHQSSRKPVESVSWLDVVERFLKTLNTAVPGLAAVLPTEAQWEYACRAGTSTATYAGDLRDERKDDVLDDIAWYAPNTGTETMDVGQKKPNPWGLYDMLGNVHEWCADEGPRRDDALATSRAVALLELTRAFLRLAYAPDQITPEHIAPLVPLLDVVLRDYGEEDLQALLTYVLSAFGPESPLRDMLYDTASQETREVFTTYRDQYIAEGEAKGMAAMLRRLLDQRGLPLTVELEHLVSHCQDPQQLQR